MASNSTENLKKYFEKLLKMGYSVKSITTKAGNKMLAFFDQKTNKFAMLLPASAKRPKTISKIGEIVSNITSDRTINNNNNNNPITTDRQI